MSRTAALLLTLGLVAACDGKPPAPVPPAPPKPPEAEVRTGTAQRAEEQEKALEAAKAVWDTNARGLLKSFDSRTYDPRRENGLVHLAGSVVVKADGGEARYRFVFDSANPEATPVKFDTVSEPAGWNPELTREMKQWVLQSCIGAYSVVVYYRPPIQWRVMPSIDKKNQVVTAPPFKGPLSVSYSLDERQVVVIRGEWTDPDHKVVTNYDWDLFHGRYFLRRASVFQGSATEFEYDDRSGVNLLAKVRSREGERVVEAEFEYEKPQRSAK